MLSQWHAGSWESRSSLTLLTEKAWGTSRGLHNREIVEAGADRCVALHRRIEASKGTKDCVRQALAAGITGWLIEDEEAIPRRIQAVDRRLV